MYCIEYMYGSTTNLNTLLDFARYYGAEIL